MGVPTATRRGPAGVRLGALLVFEIGAVVVLHRLGSSRRSQVDWADVRGWLDTVSTEDAVVAALRLVALVAAYWMLASTVLYLLARATRLPSLARSVRWATLPGVRRVVDAVVAASIAGPMTLGSAAPAMADPGVAVQVQVPSDPTTAPRYVPTAAGDQPAPAPDVPAPAVAPVGSVYTVVQGDNLWAIAARSVAQATGRAESALSDGEIARYWSRVIGANRDRLTSGDPDLVFPGDQIELPDVS